MPTNVLDEISPQNDPYHWVPDQFKYIIDHPEARLALREKFYKKYGGVPYIKVSWLKKILNWITRQEGMGISELEFMQWEINRTVLNAIDSTENSGSVWWRNVNLKFIITAEIAAEIWEGKLVQPEYAENNEVKLWLTYIKDRKALSWYRAHNASIIQSYIQFKNDAALETIYEQTFMNEVLYRLLFAQALEEDDTVFKELGVIGANPMLPSVNIMVHMPPFYPYHYPLKMEDIQNVMHRGHSLIGEIEKAFDEYLIYPHISDLYRLIAEIVNIPALNGFHQQGKPIYPNINA